MPIRSSILTRLASFATLIALLLVAPACDSGSSDDSDDGGNNSTGGSINGMWKANGPDAFYLYVTDDTVTFIDYQGDTVDEGPDCYEFDEIDIVSRTDGQYNLGDSEEPSFTIPFTFTRSGDTLTIGYGGFGLTFSKSSESLASLTPECSGFVPKKLPG